MGLRNIEGLKRLSLEEISKDLKVNASVSKLMKEGADNFEIISNNTLTNAEMARRLGKPEKIITAQRNLLIEYNFLNSKNDKTLITGKTKKLGYVPHTGGRTIYLNVGDMKAASLDPKKQYYALVEPLIGSETNGFIVRVFNTRNDALSYKPKHLQS
jgi:hypothetical protein